MNHVEYNSFQLQRQMQRLSWGAQLNALILNNLQYYKASVLKLWDTRTIFFSFIPSQSEWILFFVHFGRTTVVVQGAIPFFWYICFLFLLFLCLNMHTHTHIFTPQSHIWAYKWTHFLKFLLTLIYQIFTQSP